MSAPSIDTTHVPAPLRPLMLAMARGAAEMAGVIRRGDRRMAAEMGVNSNGDGQKRLDLDADALFRDALRRAGLRWYASEELCDPVAMQDDGDWALAIDPLDGSSSKSSRGLAITARPIATICCSPPDSVRANWPRR